MLALKRYPNVRARRVHSGQVAVRRGYMNLGPEGWPDVEVFLPRGRVLLLEAKGTKATDVSTEQSETHDWLRAHGHEVVVFRTAQEGVDAVAKAIKEGGRG